MLWLTAILNIRHSNPGKELQVSLLDTEFLCEFLERTNYGHHATERKEHEYEPANKEAPIAVVAPPILNRVVSLGNRSGIRNGQNNTSDPRRRKNGKQDGKK